MAAAGDLIRLGALPVNFEAPWFQGAITMDMVSRRQGIWFSHPSAFEHWATGVGLMIDGDETGLHGSHGLGIQDFLTPCINQQQVRHHADLKSPTFFEGRCFPLAALPSAERWRRGDAWAGASTALVWLLTHGILSRSAEKAFDMKMLAYWSAN